VRAWLASKKEYLWMAGFLIAGFLGVGIFLHPQSLYVSPDETANAFFAETFAATGHVFSFDSLSAEFDDALHPRSVLSQDGRLVPSGFLGLPVLYGIIMRIIGSPWLLWITPLIAILAVLAWYAIVRKCFDKTVAVYASLLLACHPAWWYYSARSLMPNVLFVSLLVFALFFFIVRPWHKHVRIADFFFAGLCLGLAFFVRPSEFFWVVGAVGILAIAFRHAWRWKDALVCLAGWTLFGLVPLFFFQYLTYGDWLATGYTLETTQTVVQEVTSNLSWWERFSTTPPVTWIFPFGLHLWSVAEQGWKYGVQLFWWLTLLSLGGFVLLFVPRSHRACERRYRYAVYGAILAFMSAWLFLMYGSWTFHDNPDPSVITIANSYVRYWLPVFVASTPLLALFIDWFASHANTSRLKKASAVFLLGGCALLNMWTVFWRGDDGLLRAASIRTEDEEVRAYVLKTTETDAVMVVDRADKIFFPYRRVVYPLRDEATYDLLPRLLLRTDVYYYGITFPLEDVEYLNAVKLKELGLQIELMETFDEESLYRFYFL
jgi:4-amino-4-deoxy-L-arabinose transferase-like glycosyltransferase